MNLTPRNVPSDLKLLSDNKILNATEVYKTLFDYNQAGTTCS